MLDAHAHLAVAAVTASVSAAAFARLFRLENAAGAERERAGDCQCQ